jgi:hypothetical protein
MIWFLPPDRRAQGDPPLEAAVEVSEGLLDSATAARLADHAAGRDTRVHLSIEGLQPGDVGVIEATVARLHPTRPYRNKRGGEGLLARATLGDGTGDVDLVLWDDETRLVQEGTLKPGARVRLQGATVKAGYRGGVELGLGSAVLTVLEQAAQTASKNNLEGTVLAVGAGRAVGTPPKVRFQADVKLRVAGGEANIVLEGDIVKRIRDVALGSKLVFTEVRPHPLLEDWWLATPATRLLVDGRNP